MKCLEPFVIKFNRIKRQCEISYVTLEKVFDMRPS